MVDIEDIIKVRKDIHISIDSDVHRKMRILFAKYDLSLQAVIREISARIAEEDTYMMKLLSEVKQKQKERSIKKLSSFNADKIYELLENEDEDF